MKKFTNIIEKDFGILLAVLFYILFRLIAYPLRPYLNGAAWYWESSIQRLLFGLVELFIFVKIYKKEKWTDVIHFRNFKDGMAAGGVAFLIVLFDILCLFTCVKSFVNTTISTLVSCLFFQQLTTGFWEELTFRAFVLEGYFSRENQTWKTRMAYALVSFVIFGMLHAVEAGDILFALYRFVITGIWGFFFAAVYLYSHNILVPMLLHFVTDIFANAMSFVEEWNMDSALFVVLDHYINYVVLAVVFVVSILFVIKEPKGAAA